MEEVEPISMRRILGVEKKKRVKQTVYLEEEIFKTLKMNGFNISDLVNITLELYLKKKGFL